MQKTAEMEEKCALPDDSLLMNALPSQIKAVLSHHQVARQLNNQLHKAASL